MRKTICTVTALMALTLAGCTGPPAKWTGLCRVRPIVVTSGGESWWTDSRLSNNFSKVNPIFEPAGLEFKFLPTERLEDPRLYSLDDEAERDDVLRQCKQRADDDGELAVFFVDDAPVMAPYTGMAWYPSNFLGSIGQHGVIMSRPGRGTLLAHELGHSFNLRHSWDDRFTDTPGSGSSDCDSDPCNVMSYCWRTRGISDCLPTALSPQQIAEVRKWASYYPRSKVVDGAEPPPGVPRYTDNTEGIGCDGVHGDGLCRIHSIR